ncbi:autotransporter secretion inner membrane protein TamB [Rhizobium sp. RU20A]|uniref:translocation/assembly module TamB domain-containing protein n=1 Tax=Rhizobium sp. RU20A TaxID=1907412 RepID=UPI0009553AF3|nr:translocation/assembly module TamB domain-containing protein [Rhizobium sp. RU20A]SIR39383.1 autotransporter secretion inner membrane protein TamB [Rhizobium sp. RU20A]
MGRGMGWIARGVRLLGYTLVMLVILLLPVIGFLGFTAPGARLVAGLVEKVAASENLAITITDPSALLTGDTTIGAVTIADRAGVYADLRNLSINWSPSALFSMRFAASTVAAETVTLTRLPEPATETGSDSQSAGLPVEIAIDDLKVGTLTISEAIARREQVLSLAGRVEATRTRIAAKLDLNEKARPDARASADFVYDPDANALKIEASVDEPKDGILAGMLDLPGGPAVRLAVTGDGPLSNWAGRITGALDGSDIVGLDATHKLDSANRHLVTLKGDGALDRLMPPSLRPLFAGQTTIDLAAAIDPAGSIEITTGTIDNDALTLTAGGTASTSGSNDLRLSLAGKRAPVDLRLPLSSGELRLLARSANLSLMGDANAAILDLAADLASLSHPQASLADVTLHAFSDGFNLSTQSGPAQLTLDIGGAGFADPNLARLVQAPLKAVAKLAVTADTVSAEPLTIESPSIGGSITGSLDRASGAVTANLSLFAVPAVLPPDLAAKFDTTIALAAAVTTSDGRIDLRDIAIASGPVEANGTASLAGDTLDASISGTVKELKAFLADAAGTADFTATVSGPVNGLSVDANVTASGVTLAGRTLSDFDAKAKAVLSANAPTADVTVTGALDGQVIDIAAALLSENGTPRIPKLDLTIGDNKATGSFTFTPDFRPNGDISFNLPDLGLIAALAGQKASGDLAGSARLTSTDGRIALDLQANGQRITRDDLLIERPQVNVKVDDVATLRASGTVTAERLSAGENRLVGLKLAFTQESAGTGLDLTGTYDGAPLATKARIVPAPNSLTIALDSLTASPRRIPLRLAAPTTIRVVDGTAVLDGATIAASGGAITVTGRAGQALDLALALKSVPADLVNVFAAGLGAEGSISGNVTVKGSAADPRVGYALSWDGARVAATRDAGLGALAITADGTFAGGKVDLKTAISGNGLSINGAGSVTTTGNRPLALTFQGDIPFSLLNDMLAERGYDITGSGRADIRIAGTAASPQITGSIETSGARLVDVRRNLAFNDISGRVVMDGTQARIERLTGALGSGGSVTVTGTVGIASGSGMPADIAIRLQNAKYVDGTLFNATLDGDMTLTGPLAATPTLGGTVTIRNAAVSIPEKLPASLSQIDIKHENAPAAVRQMARDIARDEQEGGGGASGTIAFDLTVTSPGQFFVRGRGIDAELGGALTIRGTALAPSVSGGFDLRRGRLEILGKRLNFTEGRIGFGGGLVPTIDLKATSTAGATTVSVNVAGTANNPTVTFASSPALPQDEVLAQLIFNRSLSNLSALQIAQLAAAVSQLAGGGNTSLLDGLRNKLGVDDLDVTTDESGGASVRAGKYLNDRTYIELQQGAGANSSKATINLDVGRGVKLRGEAGADGSGAAGIFYEKEY